MIFDKIFAAGSSLPKEQNPLFWMPHLRSRTSSAGTDVSERTALTLSGYFACIRNLSEDVATLPITVVQEDLEDGSVDPRKDNDIYKLLQRKPNPLMTSFSYRQSQMANVAGWGNSYAEIVRDQRGRPRELWPIHPSRVREKVELVEGVMVHTYEVYGTENVVLPSKDVLHTKGLTIDGYTGVSILQAAAESIGVSLAEQEFTGKFLGNGAALSGVLTHPKTMNSDAFNRLRQSWGEAFKGSANAGKPAILEQGMEWKPLSIPQRDAQFLEQRQFSIVEMARWFRMPPHKIMALENATYSNIESQDQQYVVDTMMPWLKRIEEEYTDKLFSAIHVNQGYMVMHDVEGRLRGDSAARSTYYNTMLFNGSMTLNEVRRKENLNPIGPEGDVHFMQSAMTTVQNIVNPPEPPPAPAPVAPEEEEEEPDEEPEAPEDTPDQDDNEEARAILLRAAAERVVRKTLKATERERDEEWLGKFYHAQATYLVQEIVPICKAFNGTIEAHQTSVESLYDADILTSYLISNWRSL